MSESGIVIAIDGPSGVGKSTISRNVAARLGFTYLDTGAMYRAVALFLHREGVDPGEQETVKGALGKIYIELFPAHEEDGDVQVLLNGEEVGELIRTPEISMLASQVSAIPAVRDMLTEMQRKLGAQGTLVAEGRDTGTVVFPEATFKFYLDAAPEERTRRRALQLRERGEMVDEKKLFEMTVTRDKNDSERDVAPLKQAEDAIYIDTTGITAQRVLEEILSVVTRV